MANLPVAPSAASPSADQGETVQASAAIGLLKNPLRRIDAKSGNS